MTGELDWKAEQEQWESDHPSMIRADLETRLRQLTTAAVFPATMATTRDYVYRPCLADDACPDLADNDVAPPGALCHRHAWTDGGPYVRSLASEVLRLSAMLEVSFSGRGTV